VRSAMIKQGWRPCHAASTCGCGERASSEMVLIGDCSNWTWPLRAREVRVASKGFAGSFWFMIPALGRHSPSTPAYGAEPLGSST